mmetsp:Transcript_19391/g.26665  ORF Transcript_19391/g.26665 Transcript_19391/m.26665 type:complete len:80 (+) Transcript_19391:750-989(+)
MRIYHLNARMEARILVKLVFVEAHFSLKKPASMLSFTAIHIFLCCLVFCGLVEYVQVWFNVQLLWWCLNGGQRNIQKLL